MAGRRCGLRLRRLLATSRPLMIRSRFPVKTDWHALHIAPDAPGWLRKYGLDPLIPTERRLAYTRRHHASLRRREDRPLFPGLAFVEIGKAHRNPRGDIRWDRILAIPRVTGIFAPHGEPYAFREADMLILGDLAKRPELLPYYRGDRVRVVSGPYARAYAAVDFDVADVDFRAGEVRLLAEIMGKVAEFKARSGDVRKAS